MTIILAPETETLLRERAAEYGQEAAVLARNLLTDLLTKPIERTDEEKEMLLDQIMLEKGLISRIPPPRDPSKAERPIFHVSGKPLSETIMEERR